MDYLENILQDLLTEFVEDRIFEVNYLIDPNASHLFNKFNTSAIKTKLSKTLDKLKPMATGKFVHSAVITLNNGDRKIIYFPDGLSDNKTSIYLKTNQYQCVDFKSGYGGFKIKIYDDNISEASGRSGRSDESDESYESNESNESNEVDKMKEYDSESDESESDEYERDEYDTEDKSLKED